MRMKIILASLLLFYPVYGVSYCAINNSDSKFVYWFYSEVNNTTCILRTTLDPQEKFCHPVHRSKYHFLKKQAGKSWLSYEYPVSRTETININHNHITTERNQIIVGKKLEKNLNYLKTINFYDELSETGEEYCEGQTEVDENVKIAVTIHVLQYLRLKANNEKSFFSSIRIDSKKINFTDDLKNFGYYHELNNGQNYSFNNFQQCNQSIKVQLEIYDAPKARKVMALILVKVNNGYMVIKEQPISIS